MSQSIGLGSKGPLTWSALKVTLVGCLLWPLSTTPSLMCKSLIDLIGGGSVISGGLFGSSLLSWTEPRNVLVLWSSSGGVCPKLP